MNDTHWSDAFLEKVRKEREAELAEIDARYPVNADDPPEVQEEMRLQRATLKNDIS